MLSFLQKLLRFAPRQRPDLQFTLITRKNCHLCDDALMLLEEARRRNGVSLEIVDVDSSAELLAQHDKCVPVVLVNGKVRFRGKVNRVLLQRLLNAAP